MGREIEHYSLFEHVNMEKVTPHFWKLAKCSKPDYKLSDIKKEDGSDFGTDKERQEFIVSYYENLYRLPPNQNNDITGCIEEFLGVDIVSSPMVSAMKISRDMAAQLDTEISLFELDKLLKRPVSKPLPDQTVSAIALLKNFGVYLGFLYINILTFALYRAACHKAL